MWAAGAVAAMSSITFPAISAIVSRNADPDQQGKRVTGLFDRYIWRDSKMHKIKPVAKYQHNIWVSQAEEEQKGFWDFCHARACLIFVFNIATVRQLGGAGVGTIASQQASSSHCAKTCLLV